MRKWFGAFAVLMALVISVSAFADGPKVPGKTLDESQYTQLDPPEKGIHPDVCPGQTNGNQTDFSVWAYDDLFVVQRASGGRIRVHIDFNDGSAQANVRLISAGGAKTGAVRFSFASPTYDFIVGCGDWTVWVASSSLRYAASGSISAYPQ